MDQTHGHGSLRGHSMTLHWSGDNQQVYTHTGQTTVLNSSPSVIFFKFLYLFHKITNTSSVFSEISQAQKVGIRQEKVELSQDHR